MNTIKNIGRMCIGFVIGFETMALITLCGVIKIEEDLRKDSKDRYDRRRKHHSYYDYK